MAFKTIDFLPDIFKSEANKKFLGATLDQVVSQPEFTKVNGYIGRKLAPTYKSSDNYLLEDTKDRANYQLEPGLVISDNNNNIYSFTSYTDLIGKISFYGGIVNDHSRLFSSNYYSYGDIFDLDKLVNFSQYYWMPNGPPIIDIFASGTTLVDTFNITHASNNLYVNNKIGSPNTNIVVARGGNYTFTVDPDVNGKLWIQTNSSPTGIIYNYPNQSSRQVYGITNNGAPYGEITFSVPNVTDQQFYENLADAGVVDYATSVPFVDINNHLLSTFNEKWIGFDGVTTALHGKHLIFVNHNDLYDKNDLWKSYSLYDNGVYEDLTFADEQESVLFSNRGNIWRISLVPINNGADYVIRLTQLDVFEPRTKLSVLNGQQNAGKAFYKDSSGYIAEVPLITAPLSSLYYVYSDNDTLISGKIIIVAPDLTEIDVERDILGQSNYTSPNDVAFSNGMRIRFSSTVIPASYENEIFYVEQVGKGIRLINEKSLFVTESLTDRDVGTVPLDIFSFDADLYDEAYNSAKIPDFITINRSSIDGNSWSRSNRWIHKNVIEQAARFNNESPILDQDFRALRPIIEFDPDILLFNHGREIKGQVDILDLTTVTDAFNSMSGAITFNHFGITLKTGTRIIFAADVDPAVRNKIYTVHLVVDDNLTKIQLIPDADVLLPYHSIVPMQGVNKGKTYWYNGTIWIESQRKTATNQAPRFDILDNQGMSFGNDAVYPGTTFNGNTLFGYAKATTTLRDPVLGFAIKYKNISNIGDLEFTNYFDVGTFDYFTTLVRSDKRTARTSTGNINKITNRATLRNSSMWEIVAEKSKQHQIFTYAYTQYSKFQVDIRPNSLVSHVDLRVYVNSVLLPSALYVFNDTNENMMFVDVNYDFIEGDKIDILIHSREVSSTAYYEVPRNLDLNSKNSAFDSLTLGQLRNHLTTVATVTTGFLGDKLGANNLRDLHYSISGGDILLQQSPVIYSQLFLLDPVLNFVDSVEHAQKEYAKFKYKFLDAALSLQMESIPSPVQAVDMLLTELNIIKNNSFPWYYSDMLPYESSFATTLSYVILNSEITDYEMSAEFDKNKLSNKSVLVYYNGVQLIHERDYIFREGFPILRLLVETQVDDTLQIVEYSNTDGCYVPETPTKLGVFPRFVPEIRLDDTFSVPQRVIIGHDGSVTIAFNDYRDDLLLELEKRIYNNLKVTYNTDFFNIASVVPGKFRTTDYSKTEFDKILSRLFLKWVGNNRIDFSTNSYFTGTDPWSWNHSGNTDKITDEFLPGFWRGIYHYFYDTDTPHITPWEMLGLTVKPDWWETQYGPAPYTGGNLVMWRDLEKGLIVDGPAAGIVPEFARPGLLRVIPVDENGRLKPPSEFIMKSYDPTNFSTNFVFGDRGPVEAAWRRSSDYPFALQIALALAKPAQYMGNCLNISNFTYNARLGQLLTARREVLSPSVIEINGEIVNGVVTRNAGYLNWIVDWTKLLGIDGPLKVRTVLDKVDVRLGYKLAGFTDHRYLEVYAEQSSPTSLRESIVVPNESYKIYLHKSPPVIKATYSAVIVEKSSNGYSVKGYDVMHPYFTILPSIINSRNNKISVINEVGTIYSEFEDREVDFPYGTEFTTKQQVVDFLTSYQRYLQKNGFVFETWNPDLECLKDWTLSVKEFLTWSQQGWNTNDLIVLSPFAEQLTFKSGNYFVDEVKNQNNRSKVLDQNFMPIKAANFSIVRDDDVFTLTAPNQTIAYAELHLVQFEHAIVFDNETLFKDVIYKPESGNRQFRLKLVGSKTSNWTGRLSPGGFIYNDAYVPSWQPSTDYKKGELVEHKSVYYVSPVNIIAQDQFDFTQWQYVDKKTLKSGLLQNFSLHAQKFEEFYDIDTIGLSESVNVFAKGVIGFRPRQYLSDLGLDSTTQLKFYQGFIRDKGTVSSLEAMKSATFNNLANEVTVYEEWALRMGDYGGVDHNQFFEIALDKGKYSTDPVTLELLNDTDTEQSLVIGVKKKHLYKQPTVFNKNFVQTRSRESVLENDLLTAGYVNIDDIDITIFDLTNYIELNSKLATLGSGTKIWIAKDFTRNWNVFRVNETENQAISIKYIDDLTATVTTEYPHGLVVGEVFAFKGLAATVDSFYRVEKINSIYDVTVLFLMDIAELKNAGVTGETGVPTGEVVGRAILYRLSSLRYAYLSDITDTTLLHNWKTIDKVWVDNADSSGNWGVLKKNEPFVTVDSLLPTNHSGEDNFGSCVCADKDAKEYYAVGQPVTNNFAGIVSIYGKDIFGQTVLMQQLSPINPDTLGFGYSIDISKQYVVIGAPASSNNIGHVYVFRKDVGASLVFTQLLTISDADARFGTSVTISNDNQWIYVGAPGINKVFCYSSRYIKSDAHYIQTVDSVVNYTLDEVYHPESVTLYNSVNNLVLPSEYSIVGDQLVFLNNPSTSQFRLDSGPYYELNSTLTESVSPGSQFGTAVKTTDDGSQLVVGAPYSTEVIDGTQYTTAGSAYLYSRTVSEFVANGVDNAFTVLTGNVDSVLVDNERYNVNSQYTVTGNVVSLNSAATVNSIVRVDLRDITLIKKLLPSVTAVNATFGMSVDMSNNGSVIVVGAPYYTESTYHSGMVTRFVNIGLEYGIVTATATPSISIGQSLFINNNEVISTGITLATFVTDINDAAIPGVTASTADGHLSITVTGVRTTASIMPGYGSLFSDFAFDLVKETQRLLHPGRDHGNTQQFGMLVKYDNTSRSLAISSQFASLTTKATIDSGTTLFDNRMTEFYDSVTHSGVVYTYELLVDSRRTSTHPDRYCFIQELVDPGIKPYDRFGHGLSFVNNTVIVGSPGSDDPAPFDAENDNHSIRTDIGKVYFFKNENNTPGWEKFRSQAVKVDISCINRAFIYSKKTNEIIANLDFIDPVKGKLLGVVNEDIDFRTTTDPARYNVGTDVSLAINSSYRWGAEQVGKVWWDLSSVRFVEYEQGSLLYRTVNWGRMFPGSVVSVYEWIESDVTPEEHVAQLRHGTPKYPSNEGYAVSHYVDKTTDLIKNKYYFWVKNKETVSPSKAKSIVNVTQYLTNPRGAGIPYAAFVASNSVALYGVTNLLADSDIILHIEYSKFVNSEKIPVHSEYEFIQEGNPDFVFPEKFVNKVFDSLIGFDRLGRLVPDPTILETQRYGLGIRPTQTIFKDRFAASKVVVSFVNATCLLYPIAIQTDISALYQASPLPAETEYDLKVMNNEELSYVDLLKHPDGTRILIVVDSNHGNQWAISTLTDHSTLSLLRKQIYNTTDYWSLVDWYAPGYDPTTKFTYTVESEKNVDMLQLVPEDVIFVKNSNKGGFLIYKIDSNLTKTLVGIQNGTIQLSSALYTVGVTGVGFDTSLWSQENYDPNNASQYRIILETLRDSIFTKSLQKHQHEMLFELVYYVMYEQKDIDWLFKSSFVSVVHKLRKLDQYPSFTHDNQDYYLQYINEVKPYRTKVREYLVNYSGLDYFRSGLTDFDLPPYYDTDVDVFRSPSGELVKDATLLTTRPDFAAWNANHAYKVDSIAIVSTVPGFEVPPTVVVSGGGGSGCTCTAVINFYTGDLIEVIVDNPGSGYTSTPTVTVNGAGGSAVLYAILSNRMVRTINETVSFDRCSYESTLIEWKPYRPAAGAVPAEEHTYYVGDKVYYNNVVYEALETVVNATTFSISKYKQVDAATLNINDKIVAYYEPVAPSNPKQLDKLLTGISYTGVEVTGLPFSEGADTGVDSPLTDYKVTYVGIAREGDTRMMTESGNIVMVTPASVLFGRNRLIAATGEFVVTFSRAKLKEELIAVPSSFIATGNKATFVIGREILIANGTVMSQESDIIGVAGATASVITHNARERYLVVRLLTGLLHSGISQPLVDTNNVITVGTLATTVERVTTKVDSVISSKFTDLVDIDLTYEGSNAGPNYVVGSEVVQLGSNAVGVVFSHNSVDSVVGLRIRTGTFVSGVGNYITDGVTTVGTTSITVTNSDYSNLELVLDDDIVVDGGGFIDVHHSHAPEELLPGQTFDSLAISVFTRIPAGTFMGYRLFKDLNGNMSFKRISASNTTSLSADLLVTDKVIHVTDASRLPEPDAAKGIPGELYIDGELIVYYERDVVNNTLSRIRRHVGGTGSPLIHAASTKVTDSSVHQSIPGAIGLDGTHRIWLELSHVGTDLVTGAGLAAASTYSAQFIRNELAYDPGGYVVTNTAFDLTGTVAVPARGYRAISTSASFVLDGTWNNLRNLLVATESAAFDLTGTALAITEFSDVIATPGDFAVAASNIEFRYFNLVSDSMPVSVVGTNVGITTVRLNTTDSGVYTLIGTAIGATEQSDIIAISSEFAVIGADVVLRQFKEVTVGGTYTLVGANVGTVLYRETTESGSIAITGTQIVIAVGHVETAENADMYVIGTDVGYSRLYSNTAISAEMITTGTDVPLRYFSLRGDPEVHNLIGAEIEYRYFNTNALTSPFVVTGNNAPINILQVADSANYAISGNLVPISRTMVTAPLEIAVIFSSVFFING